MLHGLLPRHLTPLRRASNFCPPLEIYATSSGIPVVATLFSSHGLPSFVLLTKVVHVACRQMLDFGGAICFVDEAPSERQHVSAVEEQVSASPSLEGRWSLVTGKRYNYMTSNRGGRRRQRILEESRRSHETSLHP